MTQSVRFNRNGEPGEKIGIDRRFSWYGCDFWIPAVYVCEEGLVMDTCLETDRETMAAFLNKWRYLFEGERLGQEPNQQEQRQFRQENPLERNYQMMLEYNGAALQYEGGTGRQWIPGKLHPIFENDMEMPAFMEQYALPQDRVWRFRRDRFRWAEPGRQELQSLILTLTQRPSPYYGMVFSPKEVGERIEIPNLLDGSTCVLTVKNISQVEAPCPEEEGLLFPQHCISMGYTLEPELPQKVFALADVKNSDQPKRIGKTDKLGGAIGVIIRNREQPENRVAVSSLHFEKVESVTWQAVFWAKTVEDRTISLFG